MLRSLCERLVCAIHLGQRAPVARRLFFPLFFYIYFFLSMQTLCCATSLLHFTCTKIRKEGSSLHGARKHPKLMESLHAYFILRFLIGNMKFIISRLFAGFFFSAKYLYADNHDVHYYFASHSIALGSVSACALECWLANDWDRYSATPYVQYLLNRNIRNPPGNQIPLSPSHHRPVSVTLCICMSLSLISCSSRPYTSVHE